MDSKKINQLGTEVDPQQSDLTVIGDPISGQLKKITWLQVANLIGAQASVTLQQVTDNGNTTNDPITTAGLTLTNLGTGLPRLTSGEFVGTYGYGLANGVATLDSGGKIPASQLPSSVMEYKGVWNATTNTPTLADGTGDNGDVYLVNVAGSQNLGSGTISFAVGDWVVYNGTIWQKSLNSNAVASVFGRTGTIVAQEGDYNIDQLGDVAITSAATNDYLRYNGSSWVNTQFPTFVSSDKLVLQVRNTSGATINKGTVVYINGAAAGYPTIAKAQANADATSAQTIGMVQDNISNNSNGVVVIVGQITGVDTSAYTAGTQLYLSGSTAGAVTSTKTLAPTHLVYVGIVTTQNAVNGVIEVKIQNGYELDEIHDVAISSVANNDGLFYESSTSLWKNKSISTILGGTPIIGSGTNTEMAYFSPNGNTLTSSPFFYISDVGTKKALTFKSTYNYITSGDNVIGGTTYPDLNLVISGDDNILFKVTNASITAVEFKDGGNALFNYNATISGTLIVSTISAKSTAGTIFLTTDSSEIKSRTAAQVLSDISALPLAGGTLTGALYGTSAEFSSTGKFGQAAGAVDTYITIGENRTATSPSYIDLIGDTTYNDYGIRLFRTLTGETGANVTSGLIHRGTGNFIIQATEAATIKLQTLSTDRLTIDGNGATIISKASSASAMLSLNATSGQYTQLYWNNAGTTYGSIYWDNTGSTFNYYTSGTHVFTGAATFSVNAANTSQLTLNNSNGAATQNMHLGAFAGNAYLSTNWYYNGAAAYDDNTKKSASIVLNGDGSINLNTANAGNTAPDTKLTISSTGVATFGSSVKVTGSATITGNGLEMYFSSNTGYFGAYDRGSSVYRDILIYAKTYLYDVNGTERFNMNSSGIDVKSGTALRLFETTNTNFWSYYTYTDNSLRFNYNGAGNDEIVITSDGYLRLASKGIQFNGDTADANSLDDYEEGTWTPSITYDSGTSGVTYSGRAGKYTKIGRVVHIEFVIGLSSKGTGSNDVTITGLPFTVANDMSSGEPACVNISYVSGLSTSVYFLNGWANNNSTVIQLRKQTSSTTTMGQSYVLIGDISDTLYIQGCCTYHV
jgi:hypothetical protein